MTAKQSPEEIWPYLVWGLLPSSQSVLYWTARLDRLYPSCYIFLLNIEENNKIVKATFHWPFKTFTCKINMLWGWHLPMKSRLMTCPHTDVILNLMLWPMKFPVYSWTEHAPFRPFRVEQLPVKEKSTLSLAADSIQGTIQNYASGF